VEEVKYIILHEGKEECVKLQVAVVAFDRKKEKENYAKLDKNTKTLMLTKVKINDFGLSMKMNIIKKPIFML